MEETRQERNVDLARRGMEAYNRGDIDAVFELFSADVRGLLASGVHQRRRLPRPRGVAELERSVDRGVGVVRHPDRQGRAGRRAVRRPRRSSGRSRTRKRGLGRAGRRLPVRDRRRGVRLPGDLSRPRGRPRRHPSPRSRLIPLSGLVRRLDRGGGGAADPILPAAVSPAAALRPRGCPGRACLPPSAYQRRAHGDSGFASRTAATSPTSGTRMPTTADVYLPFSAAITEQPRSRPRRAAIPSTELGVPALRGA